MRTNKNSNLDSFAKFKLADNQAASVKGGNDSTDTTVNIIIVDDIFD